VSFVISLEIPNQMGKRCLEEKKEQADQRKMHTHSSLCIKCKVIALDVALSMMNQKY